MEEKKGFSENKLRSPVIFVIKQHAAYGLSNAVSLLASKHGQYKYANVYGCMRNVIWPFFFLSGTEKGWVSNEKFSFYFDDTQPDG